MPLPHENMNESEDSASSSVVNRRDVFTTASIFSLGSCAPYILKAAIDSYVHEDWEYGDPSAREEVAHIPAIEKLEEENELGLHIVELGLEPEESIVSEENLDIIGQKLSGLQQGLKTYVNGYNVDLSEEYVPEIRETPVKQSKELTGEIEEQIIEESIAESIEDEDIIMYVGNFRSEFGDYVGDSHSNSNSGAIANKGTDTYTINQVLHNTGHKLSLPHTLSEDVMTWSFYKALFANSKVFGYHGESRENLEKSIKYHLEE